MKLLVIHGPNLNLLGRREPEVYGRTTLEEINGWLKEWGKQKGVQVDAFQSNSEGEIVTKIQQAGDKHQALVINPGAYTHTSVAIRDAAAACGLPVVEVHLSNIFSRGEYRHRSYLAEVASGQIAGFGPLSYLLGLTAAHHLASKV